MNISDKELYKAAKRRVMARKAFKIHLATFAVVSLFLFIISYLNRENWWIFPVIGWDIGVVIHAVSVSSALGAGSKIEREMEALKKEKDRFLKSILFFFSKINILLKCLLTLLKLSFQCEKLELD